jgi:hypothetical protein
MPGFSVPSLFMNWDVQERHSIYYFQQPNAFPKNGRFPTTRRAIVLRQGTSDECEEWFKKAMAIDEDEVKRAWIGDLIFSLYGTA